MDWKQQAKCATIRLSAEEIAENNRAMEPMRKLINEEPNPNPVYDEEDLISVKDVKTIVAVPNISSKGAVATIWPIHTASPKRFIEIVRAFVKSGLNPKESFTDKKEKTAAFINKVTNTGDGFTFIGKYEQEIFFDNPVK